MEEIQQEVKKGGGAAFLLISLVVLLVGSVCAASFYLYRLEKNSTQNNPPTSTPEQTTLEKHVSQLNTLLQGSLPTSTEAQTKRALAELSTRNDPAKGYAMLRDVAADISYPPEERALAVQTMGEIFLDRSSRSLTFASKYLFVDSPYRSMPGMAQIDDANVRKGIFELYSYADDIAPLPIVKYRLAQWYTEEAVDSPETASTSITKAMQLYEKANDILPVFITSIVSTEDSYMKGEAYRLQGTVAGNLYFLTKIEEYETEAVTAFKTAEKNLSIFNPPPSFAVEALWTNLAHAEFLSARGNATDVPTIKVLLGKLDQEYSPAFSFSKYLEGLAKVTSPAHLIQEKERIIAMKEFDTGFKTILQNLGW